MKLAGVVILYYPDEGLITRINTYRSYLDKLIIIDNSEKLYKGLDVCFKNDESVVIIQDGENKGLSKRLNQAGAIILNDGFKWFLTMDQDSFFAEDLFYKYWQCIQQFKMYDKVAVFGIEYDKRLVRKEKCSYEKVNQCITSGSIINLSVWQQIKGFDELLFIDNVDHDYCFNAVKNGYDIIKFNSFLLDHQLGTAGNYRSLKNLKKSIRRLHSPGRIYYMVRNYFYLKHKYGNRFKEETTIIKRSLLNRVKNGFLYGDQKFLLLKNIFKGYNDFIKNKMDKAE